MPLLYDTKFRILLARAVSLSADHTGKALRSVTDPAVKRELSSRADGILRLANLNLDNLKTAQRLSAENDFEMVFQHLWESSPETRADFRGDRSIFDAYLSSYIGTTNPAIVNRIVIGD